MWITKKDKKEHPLEAEMTSYSPFEVGDEVNLVEGDWSSVHEDLTSDTVGRVVEIIADTKNDRVVYLVDFWVTRKTFEAHYLVKLDNEPDFYEFPEEKEEDAKPTRYNQGTMEVWDAIIGLNLDFMQGSILKYIARYKHKNGKQDIKKAINFLIKMLANETEKDYYELRKLSIDELKEIE